jgi:two-component system, OmpR family, response regulator RpaB
MTQSKRILLVEDDRFLRKAAEVRLRRAGYIVITAADGEEAIATARTTKPDLVLLDLIMPRMQGFDVLRVLREQPELKTVPIIVFTNLSQDADRERALAHGASGYLVKANLSLDALAAAVGTALQGAA